MRKANPWFILLLGAAFLAGCRAEEKKPERREPVQSTSNWNVWVGPNGNILYPTMDNYSSRAFGRDTLYAAVLGRLLYVTRDGQAEPGLLESWQPSSDFRTWTLRLQPGLTFHNGRKVEATDLEYSLVRYLFSTRPSPGREMRLHILGADAIHPGDEYRSGAVRGVRIIDERTVEVTLKRKDPFFQYMISGGRDSLVAPEAIAEDHFGWKQFPVGAGPYRIVAVENGGAVIRTERHGNKHLSSPAQIVFNNDPKGLPIDLGVGDRNNPDPRRLSRELLDVPSTIWGIYFNYRSPLGANPEFRRAISLAFQRSQFLEANVGAEITTDVVPSNFPGRLNRPETYDPKSSREILEKLASGAKLEFSTPVIFNTDAHENAWSKVLQDQLANVGVTLQYDRSGKMVFDPKDTTTPFFILGFIPDVADPFTIYRVFREKGPWVAELPERDAEYEALLDREVPSANLSECAAALGELGEHFFAKNYAVPLFEQRNLLWVNRETVSDVGHPYQRQIISLDKMRAK